MNYWLWFASIQGVGSVRKQILLRKFGSPEDIFNASKSEFLVIDGIGEKIYDAILNSKNNLDRIDRIEKYMEKYDIGQINLGDAIYPKNLLNIYNPPITLFYKGNIEALNNKCIAVIGSRNPTDYGINVAYKMGVELSKKGYSIVSGLAKGIDAKAHQGSTKFGNCNSIAFIGSGLDYIYPSENFELYKKVENNGIILSEYIVGTRPSKTTFPARNRLISGISDKIIVVEAGKNSGTLITVDCALEQGKDVYAVPR